MTFLSWVMQEQQHPIVGAVWTWGKVREWAAVWVFSCQLGPTYHIFRFSSLPTFNPWQRLKQVRRCAWMKQGENEDSRGWWENARMERKAVWKGRGGLNIKGKEGEKGEVNKEVLRTVIFHFASFLSKTRPECNEVLVAAFLKILMWTEILEETPFLLLTRLSCLRSRTAWEVLGVKVVQEFQRQSKLFRCMPICIASGLNGIKLWLQ